MNKCAKIKNLVFNTVKNTTGYIITKDLTYHYSEATKNLFFVPVNKCVSSYAFSYDAKKMAAHPFVLLLKEYLNNPDITLEESVLYRFNDQYNPKNLQEAISGETSNIKCKTAKIPFIEKNILRGVPTMPLPWSSSLQMERFRSQNIDTVADINEHFSRTINTYLSIKERGYYPELFSDKSLNHGFIRGVMLKNDNDYRFVVLGGQHRVASLSILGYEHIPVIFQHFLYNPTPCIVDLKNLRNWPVYKMGIYDENAAITVFKAFFKSHGINSAKRYGFIKTTYC